MSHLCIAADVLRRCPGVVRDVPVYFLGSLAPDAVHFRSGFRPAHKAVSHLCPDGETWGKVEDFDAWWDKVLAYYRESEQTDFLRGYCVHILADVCNGPAFWVPFRQKVLDGTDTDYDHIYEDARVKQYQREHVEADIRLYHTFPQRAAVWAQLEKAVGVELPGLVTAEEVESIRENILYRQYAHSKAATSTEGVYVTDENTRDFLTGAAETIAAALFGDLS
jgi:hypothetical protein